MQERHKDRKLYFEEQNYTTEHYVIPFIQSHKQITAATRVLEIGCGEGGNLKPFLDMGCRCVGIDLNKTQIENARQFYNGHPYADRIEFICSDIYDVPCSEKFKFDVIMLRDVIEHLFFQDFMMHLLKRFLLADGVLFLAFPPWQNPFGGHQQICVSKLSKIPFVHLLPRPCYRALLRASGEKEGTVRELLEIKQTGITIERFQRIVRKEKYVIKKRILYFINPNYEIKFHLKPRRTWQVFRSIPYLRDFYTTAGYYLLSQKN